MLQSCFLQKETNSMWPLRKTKATSGNCASLECYLWIINPMRLIYYHHRMIKMRWWKRKGGRDLYFKILCNSNITWLRTYNYCHFLHKKWPLNRGSGLIKKKKRIEGQEVPNYKPLFSKYITIFFDIYGKTWNGKEIWAINQNDIHQPGNHRRWSAISFKGLFYLGQQLA